MAPKVIALYLPQYHPTPTNDRFYGKGFTEWTNAAKAKSLFKGHYQPNVPADLGFYDLRLAEAREAQANLAREYGVSAFCYYHYRFSSKHRELETPINEMLKSGRPDFPFMICWVNENWYKKFWSADATYSTESVAEQVYEGPKDYEAYFYEVLPFFLDKRYLRTDGRPMFMIYNPLNFPDCKAFMELWESLAKKEGLNGMYFMAYSGHYDEESARLGDIGFQSIVSSRIFNFLKKQTILEKKWKNLVRRFIKQPHIISYKKASSFFIGEEASLDAVCPTIIPNWDHTPRSALGGWVLQGSTPSLFKDQVRKALQALRGKPEERQVMFLKSWNEWGEGNYVEPDLRWGKAYLEALRDALAESSPNG